MGFSLGVVGLPNVGKSTIFSALSLHKVDIQNYPFTTIDPNIGVVNVPDDRLEFISQNFHSAKTTPTIIEFHDIAGLVKGAYKGEGLGNKFLSNIRAVDAIAHVVRCFSSSDVVHVNGKVDPVADAEIVETELIMSDLEIVDRKLSSLRSEAKTGNKAVLAKLELCEKLKDFLAKGNLASCFAFGSDEELPMELSLITIKPILFIANIGEDGKGEGLDQLIEYAKKRKCEVVPICAKVELELLEFAEDDASAMREELGIKESGLDRVIKSGYKILDLITFFTSNAKETKGWTIKNGGRAIDGAYKIHTDMGNKFIAGEIIHFEDLKKRPKIDELKKIGGVHLVGKDYILQDGDLLFIRFGG